jgi:hypothetical protein
MNDPVPRNPQPAGVPLEETSLLSNSTPVSGESGIPTEGAPQGPPPGPFTPAATGGGRFPQDFGRYILRARLGAGGMGTVYRAYDTRLDIEVALKMPHAHLIDHPEVLERFYREARAAARLNHSNLCRIFDVGQWSDYHYIAMSYVEGKPLSKSPPADSRAAAALVRKVADAVAEAHRHGIIHRDLKPANILITPRGEPVVMDFGAALRLDEDGRLTQEGSALGTPLFMSPEQFRGDRDAQGPGCDIYSLGVILYELLAGHLPFAGPRETLYEQVQSAAPAPPSAHCPGIAPRLDAICLKALAKRAADRFPSMEGFVAALDLYLGESEAAAGGPLADVRLLPIPAPEASGEVRRRRVTREAIRFAFAGYGERAAMPVPANRLYLDVGNALCPGVIDHHHLTTHSGSTTGLVLAHPEFVAGSAPSGRKPEDPLTIVLHEQPDLDCLASAYLAAAYLTSGEFPDGSDALARYAAKVDEGALGMTLANPFALYAALMQLANRLGRATWHSNHQRWTEHVRRGLEVITYVLDQVARRGTPLPAVDAFACIAQMTAGDRQEVQADVERYRRKMADPRTQARRAQLRLPSQFGGKAAVEALLVRDVQNTDDPEHVVFFKDWARTDAERCPNGRGFVALSVFMSEGPHQVRRCILSVTPDSGASIQGLGGLLDRAEAERREQVFGSDDRVTDPATGAPRPPRPGYGNADPWYDGRAHDYTIVDSPRSGTMLTTEEIEGILLQFGDSETPQPLGR